MTFQPTGNHLIAGHWTPGTQSFMSSPAHGPAHSYSVGSVENIDKAVEAAEDAFWSFGYSSRDHRAAFLHAIADEIEARGDAITEIGCQETGLPEARLQGERGRTTGQLRLFAEHLLQGKYLDLRHDPVLIDRKPLPRPDLKMIQRPIGPVAVFGASNFPLAFSTAGGDTAAAMAAGCPVVVKGHSAHPGTGEIIAEAILAAIQKCDVHPGVFSLIQGGDRAVGTRLVQHPLIKAVGFTGSLAGGRALYDLCAARPEPIPFFGELGSVNPMFLLPEATKARGTDIGTGWAASLTMGAGQFCTNPGIAVVLEDISAPFIEAATEALAKTPSQVMLTDGIAEAYRRGQQLVAGSEDVDALVSTTCDGRVVTPYLYQTNAKTWLQNADLGEEVFGPLGLIVIAKDMSEMRDIAQSLLGQLTVTLHLDQSDEADALALLPILERKAGRLLANGYPTGVEVADSMVHGGPYPASTNFGATSVGTLSIRRFLRPVCFQNFSDTLLSADLLT
jgi:alpha-ketoglutaric semialdehyde dehydrogenase